MKAISCFVELLKKCVPNARKREPGSIRANLIENKWRQGACFELGSYQKLKKLLHPTHQKKSGEFFYIVLTHDCSIVSDDFDKEPMVEYIAARLVCKPVPEFMGIKNNRKLHLPCKFNGEDRYAELLIYQRQFFDRKQLLNFSPCKHINLKPETVKQLARWVALRYTRAAFPDNFNNRLQAISKKLNDRFKKPINEHVNSIWFELNPRYQELLVDQRYDLEITLVFDDEYIDDPANHNDILQYVDSLKGIFVNSEEQKISGIRLIDVIYQSMSDTDLFFLSTRDRFDLDYLSFRDKPGGEYIKSDI
jgi:hypothetical protein